MSNDFELSRRKALAALGSIGVASAGAGLGTSAYFSDQETFQNNRLVAGELDLKMDWEEHYSDWSADEGDGIDVRMEEPTSGSFRRFPAGATSETIGDHGLYVASEDVPQFMDNTSIDALPDSNNDGVAGYPIEQMVDNQQDPCELLVDVGDDDGGLSSDLRTNSEVTASGDPLINLQDVKPGDFGEVTFSIHFCGDPANPGYLWMNMPGGLSADENGVTEPEGDDPDEEEGVVELPDEIQTALWYDEDCNNLPGGDKQDVDLLILVDKSGSFDPSERQTLVTAGNQFLTDLRDGTPEGCVDGGLVTFSAPAEAASGDISQEVALSPNSPGLDEFFDNGNADVGQYIPSQGDGSTPTPAALDIARQILNNEGRSDAKGAILLITDDGPNYNSGDGTTYELSNGGGYTYTHDEMNTPTFNDSESTKPEQDETARVADVVDGDDIKILTLAVGGTGDDVGVGPNAMGLESFLETRVATDTKCAFDATVDSPQNFNQIAQEIADRIIALTGSGNAALLEKVIFTGTLREFAEELTANEGRGLPLDGDPVTPFDETADGAETAENRDCFVPATHCFGFSWWLPLNHGNEVQSDSASFDIGFYTEQCRHNDGSGMNNENVDA